MQRPREQFLACAALAFEQHRGVGARRPLQRHDHLFQRRRLADDLRRAAAHRELVLEQNVFGDQAALGQRALDEQQQMVGIDGLGEKIERAFLHRRDGVLNAAVGGHHDDRQLRIQLLRGAKHAEAVALREPEIGHDDSRPLLQRQNGFGLIARFDDGVPLAFDGQAQHRAEGVFVFD